MLHIHCYMTYYILCYMLYIMYHIYYLYIKSYIQIYNCMCISTHTYTYTHTYILFEVELDPPKRYVEVCTPVTCKCEVTANSLYV